MNGSADHSTSYLALSKKERSDHESSSDDDEEEVSFINPFARSRLETMRHRVTRGKLMAQPSRAVLRRRFDPYGEQTMNSLSFINEDHDIISDHMPTRPSYDQTPSVADSLSTRGATLQPQLIPGTEGFLEMEEESTSVLIPPTFHGDDGEFLDSEPVRTSSGLLLTHRHTPMSHPQQAYGGNGNRKKRETFFNVPGPRVLPHGEAFEVESGYAGANSTGLCNPYYSNSGPSSALVTARRLLSYVRLWNAAFCIFLLIGTGVVVHSMRHESSGGAEVNEREALSSGQNVVKPVSSATEASQITEQIILVPLQNVSHRRTVAQPKATLTRENDEEPHDIRRSLHALREEFEGWVQKHSKVYHSEDEKERRFKVWHDNHHRTIEKNKRHGPCKLTKQPVFGSNHFKDLTSEEFKSQYLTGYNGPHTDHLEQWPMRMKNDKSSGNEKHRRVRSIPVGSGGVPGYEHRADPRTSIKRHPAVQERYLEAWKPNESGAKGGKRTYTASYQSYSKCKYYDVSCWLRWFMYTYGYGIGGTMEPNYDSDAYPSAIDWREYGAVTDVHSQGNCGACWAITAVETMESAYAIASGNLMDLAESEIIVCDDTCEMCNGGWPQNAYAFNMEQGGLLKENSWSYDGDFLYQMTVAKAGESNTYSESDVKSYATSVCPNGSGDNSHNNEQRYAKVKGYGYATERCICYTDGTGCDCDEQDERKALMNVATYGPAAVCLEASTWQDYAGGILTSEVGCSAKFLDMNHCVQAVGYAYVDTSDDGDANNGGSGSHSGKWKQR